LKLRIRDNSIRLRLSQSEVDRVAVEGRLAARVSFPDGRGFEYALRAADADPGHARYADDGLEVAFAADAIRSWAGSDQVGLRAELPLGGGAVLTVVVEKDFACLSPRPGEDEADMFPHPDAGQRTC
jgi:hypothetical protein